MQVEEKFIWGEKNEWKTGEFRFSMTIANSWEILKGISITQLVD